MSFLNFIHEDVPFRIYSDVPVSCKPIIRKGKEVDKRGRNENSNNDGCSINKRNLYRIFNNTSGTNDKSKFGDYIYADVFVFK